MGRGAGKDALGLPLPTEVPIEGNATPSTPEVSVSLTARAISGLFAANALVYGVHNVQRPTDGQEEEQDEDLIRVIDPMQDSRMAVARHDIHIAGIVSAESAGLAYGINTEELDH